MEKNNNDGSWWIRKCSSEHWWHSKLPQRFVEEEFKLLDDDEDEDKDASENDENDEFDLLTYSSDYNLK